MQIDNNIYSQKIHYFLTTKYFVTLRKDLTTVHQHKYNKHCQQNNILISKHRIKHLTQFSATPSPYCCWSLWWTSADGTFSPTRSLITMRCSTLRGTFCSLVTLATTRQDWTGSNPSRREGGGCGFTLSRSHSCCAVWRVYTQISPGHIWTTL